MRILYLFMSKQHRFKYIYYCFLMVCIESAHTHAQSSRSFAHWRKDLKEVSQHFESTSELWVEDIPQKAFIMSIYPQKLSVKVLDWVGKGGHLFVTLNHKNLQQNMQFLKALDLKPVAASDQTNLSLKGAWPFPSNRPHTSQLINYLLTPWITVQPLTFEEGSSWYKGEIPPIAIDEDGQSLGYRVRYGRGTLTLFGDGDALSDQLRGLAENRRFAQAIIWWISHPSSSNREEQVSSFTHNQIIFIQPNGEILSMEEEESLVHKLQSILSQIQEWWDKTALKEISLYTHLKYILLGLISSLAIILYLFTRSGYWKHKIILRRK